MAFFGCRAVSEGIELVAMRRSARMGLLHYNHVFLTDSCCSENFVISHLSDVFGLSFSCLLRTYWYHLFPFIVIRGEKARKIYRALRQRHRAATVLQRNVKSQIVRKKFVDIKGASVAIQCGRNLQFCVILVQSQLLNTKFTQFFVTLQSYVDSLFEGARETFVCWTQPKKLKEPWWVAHFIKY